MDLGGHERITTGAPAMLSDQELLRYSRQVLLAQIDIDGQLRLKQSKALIVGLGGLGSPVALYLAAAGVGSCTGRLRHRRPDQPATPGHPRQCQRRHEQGRFGLAALAGDQPGNQPGRPSPGAGRGFAGGRRGGGRLVLDCSDNFGTREAVNAACVAAGKPLVSGAAIRPKGSCRCSTHGVTTALATTACTAMAAKPN